MIKKRSWLLAVLIAVSMHAFGFMLFINKEADGAKLAGEQGIEIDLGMLGDLAESQVSEQVEVIDQTELAEPEIEPVPIAEPKPVVDSIVEGKRPVKAKQVAEIKVKTEPQKQAMAEPVIAAVRGQETISQPIKSTQRITENTKDVTKSNTSQQKQSTGEANAATTGGQVAARQSYFSLLAATLAKHKRYPISSRRKGEEGIVKLFFVVDRSGKVLEFGISESSGHTRLDEAVLSMIKKASPLPAFPADMLQPQLEVNVPIAFQLNHS